MLCWCTVHVEFAMCWVMGLKLSSAEASRGGKAVENHTDAWAGEPNSTGSGGRSRNLEL